MSYTMRRATPTPEVLGRVKGGSRRVVTFRLAELEYEKLLALARRAKVGPSSLARRIVEHYIVEHAPAGRRGRK